MSAMDHDAEMTGSAMAERVRSVILQAAVRAYEDAGVRGLCEEGRWEAAVSAMRSVDLASEIFGARRSEDAT
jgi:hypothetical protein